MLSVFKLVSCKPEASRGLALRPPKPEQLTIFKISLSLCCCSYLVIGENLILLVFE